MTVKELIEKLQTLPEDCLVISVVKLDYETGNYYYPLDDIELDWVMPHYKKGDEHVWWSDGEDGRENNEKVVVIF